MRMSLNRDNMMASGIIKEVSLLKLVGTHLVVYLLRVHNLKLINSLPIQVLMGKNLRREVII